MKRLIMQTVACLALATVVAGCASEGSIKGGQTNTSVSLAGKNYKLVKPGAMGKSSGFRLLGILPIASPTYGAAQAALYRSVGESLTGRAVALANETEDRSSLYLILFSIPRVTITADVIEFTDGPKVANSIAP